MKSTTILGLTMVLGAAGCAARGAGSQAVEPPGWSGSAWTEGPAMHVGAASVMATRINPLAPVALTAHGSAVAVSYGRSPRSRAIAHIDAASLRPVAPSEGVTLSQPDGATGISPTSDTAPARVALDRGRFVRVWKQGDAESGYRALAQEFAANGTALGSPAVLSPPSVDVMGTVQAVATDGHHVVVTFTAASESAFELMAVPLEVDAPAAADRIARSEAPMFPRPR
jgi:hypothetical protein